MKHKDGEEKSFQEIREVKFEHKITETDLFIAGKQNENHGEGAFLEYLLIQERDIQLLRDTIFGGNKV